MHVFSAQHVAEITGGTWHGLPETAQGSAAPLFSACAFDTRLIQPGECFIALETEAANGHNYLAAAKQAGAACAVVAALQPNVALPQLVVPGEDTFAALQKIAAANRAAFKKAGGTLVGITGSAGKTTCKDMLAAMLTEAFGPERVYAAFGNWNNALGIAINLTRLQPGVHTHAVLEAGISHPGDMAELAELLQPSTAVCTHIGPAHMEHLGSLEGIAKEKAQLVRAGMPEKNAHVFIGESCKAYPAFTSLASEGYHVHVVGAAHLLTVKHPSVAVQASAGLAGAVAQFLGAPLSNVQAAVAAWQPGALRGRIEAHGSTLWYADCYNANPGALQTAAEAFHTHTQAHATFNAAARIWVLGSMAQLGEASASMHAKAGAHIATLLKPGDAVLCTGAHASAYMQGVLSAPVGASEASEGGAPNIQTFESAQAALPALKSLLAAHTHACVFLKGARSESLEVLLSLQSKAEAAYTHA